MTDQHQGPLLSTRLTNPDRTDDLHASFMAAEPFPHIVLDDFLVVPSEQVVDAFPAPDWAGWKGFSDSYQRNKRYCDDIEMIPPVFRAIIEQCSRPHFLSFLERLTGIRGLMPDPYLVGGGLHYSGPGGVLAPHADFHHYARLELFRRINLILYLNPVPDLPSGGKLQLFRKGDRRPSAEIEPVYGRVVIFVTDDRSIHGVEELAQEPPLWRRSLALYYYTSDEAKLFSGDSDTHWQSHRTAGLDETAMLVAYKIMIRCSRFFSRLAHRANPALRRKRDDRP